MAAARRQLLDGKKEYVLRIEDVHKEFPGVHSNIVAVNQLALGVKRGECFGFLGPNGAGYAHSNTFSPY